MDLGITLPNRGIVLGLATTRELLELAELADRTPQIRSIWVGDSLLGKPRLESVAFLSAIAARTSRVRIGAACVASFVLRDPVLFAYQWASLDVIAEGRTVLVVCTGIIGQEGGRVEGELYNVSNRDRADRMAEWIELTRRLWTEDAVTFEGIHYRCQNVTIEPKPAARPHVPIWLASNAFGSPDRIARTHDRVARLGDGWETSICRMDELAWRIPDIRQRAADLGRDPDAIPIHLYHNMNINEDRDAALEESKRFLDAYYGIDHPPERVACWTAAGSAQACAEHLAKYATFGVQEITVRATSWDQRGQLRRFIDEVIPAYAALGVGDAPRITVGSVPSGEA